MERLRISAPLCPEPDFDWDAVGRAFLEIVRICAIPDSLRM